MVVQPDSNVPSTSAAAGATQRGSDLTLKELHDVCAEIHDRLIRVEAALQRTEGFVADKPWDVSTIAYKRLERVEDTLRLTQQTLAESTLPEMCVNIERQLVETRASLQRTEAAVSNKSVRDLCETMDARLARTEDAIRGTKDLVTDWLQELSADVTSRLAEADETLQRLEVLASNRTFDTQALVVNASPTDRDVTVRPGLLARRVVVRVQTNRGGKLPWMSGLAVAAVLLVATFAIGPLIWNGDGATPASVATQRGRNVSSQTVPAQFRVVTATTPASEPSPATVEDSSAAPREPRGRSREESPTLGTRPRAFVGTLLVTSVPSGAPVSINGQVAGVTPLRVPRQRAGSHAVLIAQDGFERWSAAVRVPADQLTQVTARLRPIVE